MVVNAKWEQDEVPQNIPVYNIEIPITGTELTVQVRGDQHIGLKCVDINEMTSVYKREQDKYRGSMFVIDTGDMIENGLKNSVGHNYDIGIPDPSDQLALAIEMQIECDKHLYGEKAYEEMKAVSRMSHKHTRRLGLLGNHEYRTRKETGIWLNNQLFDNKGVLDAGIQCLVNLTAVNKQLGLKRKVTLYCAHRLTNSSTSINWSSIYKNFQSKKSQLDADIFVCGHYHRGYVISDHKYDAKGKKKKLLYVTNPSPADRTEYAHWNAYAPSGAGYYTNFFIPLTSELEPYGII